MTGRGRGGPAFENPADDDEHPHPLLEVDDLRVRFDDGRDRETVRAVDGLSLALERGEIVGLVGESGCGKSATVRAVAGLHGGDARVDGSVRFDGIDLREVSDESLRRLRATRLSTVFQDPSATLTPTRTVEAHLTEALRLAERPADRSLRASLGFGFDLDLDPRKWGRRDDRRERAADLLEAVGLDARALEWYPHECSGGEAQRVSLAVALASDPDVLLADEPTTALDATTRAEILALLESTVADREMGAVLVSHDLGLVADVCDRVVVAYAGRVMEAGPTDRVLESPRHPYTRALLGCRLDSVGPGKRLPTIEGEVPGPTVEPAGCPFAPRCPRVTDECRNAAPPVVAVDGGDGGECGDGGRVRCGELERVAASEAAGANAVTAADGGALEQCGDGTNGSDRERKGGTKSERQSTDANGTRTAPALELCGVSKRYPLEDSWLARATGRDRWHEAVRDVSLSVRPGETLGIVGESGAGKSTVIDLVTGLEEPTAGAVRIDGEPVGRVNERTRDQLAAVGRLFQHPRSSLDPRQPVRAAIAEPLREAGRDREERRVRTEELLSLVGLEAHHADRRPGQLSGGECQRVGLARAVALEPALVVLDEPTSALDVSVRARVCNLLLELQRRLGSAFVLVSHDLGVVAHLADRIAVMRGGRVVESGPAERICESPTHDYTERLLAAANARGVGTETDSGDRPTDLEEGSQSETETEREHTK
ncbi:dipeptide ABC transporter ATP-binding protein [Halomontanus rarus]|uniref:dipeptide ABC transporter ATP-binding protein n=1 Tax=Halomontanus rarus TaxID=3034020 RepID=UPI001A99E2D8